MTRRLHPFAARVAAAVMLAVPLALLLGPAPVAEAGTPLSAAAKPTPSPSPSASASTGPQLATFGISAASGGLPDERSYLSMGAAPGSVIYDHVAIVNQSNMPLDLDVYASDAYNDASGAVGLPPRSTKPIGAGSWVSVGTDHVTVPAQSVTGMGYVIVPITIAIPVNATPGDHLAGVVASLTSRGSTSGGSQSATIDLEQRTGARLYIKVDGALNPGLAITNVHADYHQAGLLGLAGAGSMTFRYTLTNTGNTRVDVRPTVRSAGAFGLLAARASGTAVDELLPGSAVERTVELPAVWPLVLERASVSAAVSAPVGGDDPHLGPVVRSVLVWTVPWAYLTAVVVLVLAWFGVRRLRRSRPTPGGRHAGTGGGEQPPPKFEATQTGESPVLATRQVAP